MNHKPGTPRTAAKTATVALVATVGFLCGWSAMTVTSGVVLGVALAAGVAVAVFHGNHPCMSRRARSRSQAA
jgi:hypothetical protein